MAEQSNRFDNAAAYEQIMARWTRAAGAIFLEWLAAPKNARWLDIGCGTGVFTELMLQTVSASTVSAVDPSPQQIEHARSKPVGQAADFQFADAQELPFPDNSFDVVVSALVINFIPDRHKALAEMRRVGCTGGTVAGYVWDFAGEGSPGGILRAGLHAIGIEAPETTGTAHTTLESLSSLFRDSGLERIDSRAIEVTSSFATFEDLWTAQTPGFSPLTKTVQALAPQNRGRLMELVRAASAGPGGSVAYSARAHAIKASIPN